jgi:glycosyltransferase involved in cell wall biosynthesis
MVKRPTAHRPTIAAVICAHNEAHFLPDVIASLVGQTLPADAYSIVVIDNASTDATARVLKDLSGTPGLQTVHEAQPGLALARNRGLDATTADLIAFIDADAIAAPNWLERIANTFASFPRAGVVGGPVEVQWDHPRPRWWSSSLDEALNQYAPSACGMDLTYPRYPYGTNFALRRTAVPDGGFALALGRRGGGLLAAEEGELCLRMEQANWTIRFEPTAVVRHRTVAQRLRRRYVLRRAFNHGRSQALLEALHDMDSGLYPRWPEILRSVATKGMRLGWNLPFMKYILFRIGYRWQAGSKPNVATGHQTAYMRVRTTASIAPKR